MPEKNTLPLLPARKTRNSYDGYAPPEDGNAAEYWAEGFNEAIELIAARDRQIVELCAAIVESANNHDNPMTANDCAAAIRSLVKGGE